MKVSAYPHVIVNRFSDTMGKRKVRERSISVKTGSADALGLYGFIPLSHPCLWNVQGRPMLETFTSVRFGCPTFI